MRNNSDAKVIVSVKTGNIVGAYTRDGAAGEAVIDINNRLGHRAVKLPGYEIPVDAAATSVIEYMTEGSEI